MNIRNQKDMFLNSEGDAFFERTKNQQEKMYIEQYKKNHPFFSFINKLPKIYDDKIDLLEIGCGNGSRLKLVKEIINCNAYGIDPSSKSVLSAKEKGINCKVGTADNLPFKDSSFDLIIFGFCLYLCDRKDLFKIAYEADRVLKNSSWLIIVDFWSSYEEKVPYKHKENIFSYKFDYPSIFTWNPAYNVFSQTVLDEEINSYTDQKSNWVATSILRKNQEIF